MLLFSILLALALGAGLAAQAGINTSLRNVLGHPVHASVVNFIVGLALLLGYALALGLGRPPAGAFGRTSWWMYTGGLIGAAYVVGVIVLAPRLGAATLMALIIAGQLATALLLDHFGWLGFPRHVVSPGRALGALLLVAGVILVRRG